MEIAPHLHVDMYAANGKIINPYTYLKWWEMNPLITASEKGCIYSFSYHTFHGKS